MEDSCIFLMHLEILKQLLWCPYPSLEISRKKYLPRTVVDVPSLDRFKASPDSAKDTKTLELS